MARKIYMPTAESGNDAADDEQARLWAEYHALLDERAQHQAEIDRIEARIVQLKPRLERLEGED